MRRVTTGKKQGDSFFPEILIKQTQKIMRGLFIPAILKGQTQRIREGCRKKNAGKVWSFTKPGGGSPRVIKNQTPFLKKYFFSELEESF